MFPANYRWAEGVRWRGAFHWLRSDSSIASQAANFLQRVRNNGGLKVGDLLQTDWEVTPGIPLVTSDQVIEFNDRIRQAVGRDCVITYSSDWLPDSTLDVDSRREFEEWRQARPHDPLWYANYNTSSSPDGGWAECAKYGADVWQWTSKFVHPSIAGGFDMNHVFRPEVLDRLTGRADPITPPPLEDNDVKTLDQPQRVHDSRVDPGHRLTPPAIQAVPIMAKVVGVNITVVNPSADGYLVAWGAGAKPGTSNVNFTKGETVSNYAQVVLDGNGYLHLQATAECHIVVDVQAAS